MNNSRMQQVRDAQKEVKTAIKAILSKYNATWYDNEANVDQTKMVTEDYDIYSSLYDARDLLRRLANA